MRKPTIHVFTEYNRLSRIERHWEECFLHSDFEKYNVNIIDGTLIDHDSFLHADTHFKSIQLKRVMDLLNDNEIWDGDIFVFTNAWNYIAVPLSYFRDEYGLRVKLVGFWGNSMSNPNSPMHRRFVHKERSVAKEFDAALFSSYDANCFLCTEHYEQFKRFFGKINEKRFNKTAHITGFPFEYLMDKYVLIPTNNSNKDDSIIMPFYLGNVVQSRVFLGLMSEFPKYKFYQAQQTHNHRTRYLDLLNTCKIMFCAEPIAYNPILLWEGMLAGVIPMVPDTGIYKNVFPDKYRYPPELTIPKPRAVMWDTIRMRSQVIDIIRDNMEFYQQLLPILYADAKRIGKSFYSNKPILKLFKTLSNV